VTSASAAPVPVDDIDDEIGDDVENLGDAVSTPTITIKDDDEDNNNNNDNDDGDDDMSSTHVVDARTPIVLHHSLNLSSCYPRVSAL
jgi:hypothetical protein